MISSFFTADYRDGRVLFGGKSYPAGVFATHLLNQFYINDTGARIAVKKNVKSKSATLAERRYTPKRTGI